MSLLDNYTLTKENFERCICHAMKMPNLLTVFRVTGKEMDDWCLKSYGLNFQTTYEIIKQMAIERFADTCDQLGMRGNNTAMNIFDRMMNGTSQDTTVKIVFSNNGINNETETDKEDDDDDE